MSTVDEELLRRQKLLASAIARKSRLERADSFDPLRPGSRPTAAQQEIISEFGVIPVQWIVAGNRCLEAGTLIATPTGPTPIEQLRPGDSVYSEYGEVISVLELYDNGIAPVLDILEIPTGIVLASCTASHRFQCINSNGNISERYAAELSYNDRLRVVKCDTTNGLRSSVAVQVSLADLRIAHTYDIHVGSATNLYVLASGAVTHNSGKSQTASHLIMKLMADKMPPDWKRPEKWGTAPLIGIIAARTGKHIEETILPKLESYLEPDTYKVVRINSTAQRLELDNGNRIIFQSLEIPTIARERLQSYTAHIAWIDEQPPTSDIVTELLMRVQTDSGYFLATFTPLQYNIEIQKLVEGAKPPHSKRYRLGLLDNPLNASDEERKRILEQLSTLPEDKRNARLYGEWVSNNDSVYYFDEKLMVRTLPESYNPYSWRHVESCDPASSSSLGLTVWAEDPRTSIWYCVLAKYVKGLAVPTLIIQEVQRLTRDYNIVRRIADPAAHWYISQAAHMGIKYYAVERKSVAGRKVELIKQFQEKLGQKLVLTPGCIDLIEEIQEYRWSDKVEGKIINEQSYHLNDAAIYFADTMPRALAPQEEVVTVSNWYGRLLAGNEKRLQMEARVRDPRGKQRITQKQSRVWGRK